MCQLWQRASKNERQIRNTMCKFWKILWSYVGNQGVELTMRQKLITLCPITWELAQKKSNFSAWIRNQLRSERNRTENDDALKANTARQVESVANISSAELLWHLEQRSPEEIGALISILKNGLA